MNPSEEQLRHLECRGNNTLLYVLVIVVILLVTAYLYKQYYMPTPKTIELPTSPQTKELTDLANSLKTSTTPNTQTALESASDEGDVNSALSATIESHLDSVEKTV